MLVRPRQLLKLLVTLLLPLKKLLKVMLLLQVRRLVPQIVLPKPQLKMLKTLPTLLKVLPALLKQQTTIGNRLKQPRRMHGTAKRVLLEQLLEQRKVLMLQQNLKALQQNLQKMLLHLL